jgi:dUTP pyrophosphatase
MSNSHSSQSIKVKIKRFDPSLPMPEYQTAGAAAFDLAAREDTTIQPNAIGYVPLNIGLSMPEGYWAMVVARSSLHKRGLVLANSVGVGDRDYCGENDEYMAALWNMSDQAVIVKRGERIVQILILERPHIELIEDPQAFDKRSRGGYGTTGT